MLGWSLILIVAINIYLHDKDKSYAILSYLQTNLLNYVFAQKWSIM